jgi:DNA-directed RNA polymerase specialized sigma24 family protein
MCSTHCVIIAPTDSMHALEARLMLLALTPESSTGVSPSARASGAAVPERVVYDAIQSGDERQASQVYKRLLPAIQATLLRVIGGPDENHRELTQRSIEHVILELSRHPAPWVCSLDAWATTAAARVALDVLVARARETRDASSSGSAVDRLRWLLTELPRQQAIAVVLCDVMGLPVSDAALTSSLGVERLKRLLSAGHERLARLMSGS